MSRWGKTTFALLAATAFFAGFGRYELDWSWLASLAPFGLVVFLTLADGAAGAWEIVRNRHDADG